MDRTPLLLISISISISIPADYYDTHGTTPHQEEAFYPHPPEPRAVYTDNIRPSLLYKSPLLTSGYLVCTQHKGRAMRFLCLHGAGTNSQVRTRRRDELAPYLGEGFWRTFGPAPPPPAFFLIPRQGGTLQEVP